MPKQIQSNNYTEARISFQQMSFTPDVPSTQLGPNEYNYGENVETDVRGIRSMAGDQAILETVPGIPTFVTGGFRQNNTFWFIVATYEPDPLDPTNTDANIGRWYASDGVTPWYDITPGGTAIIGYNQATNITESWNGTIPLFNDTWTAPMFLPDEPGAILTQYSNLIVPADINDIVYVNATTQQIQLVTPYTSAPYIAGQKIVISGVNNFYNGEFTVVSSTTTTIDYLAVPGGGYPGGPLGSVAPAYTWNYNPNWKKVIANFMRMYSTPNVGSILVAGNLTVTSIDDTVITGDVTYNTEVIATVAAANSMLNADISGTGIPVGSRVISVDPGVSLTISRKATVTNTGVSITLNLVTNYPTTVQWSQNFGLNQAPATWQPTITNVANSLEVPLRGPALDSFPCNGQFFLCSYWDTVVFSPINYSTTSAPILGVRQFNQGRGLLSSNCWANTDKLVYGIDARDIWVFDGQDFKGLGNQRVKNWFYDQLDQRYYDRVYMEVNSQRSQVEIYYTTADKLVDDGVPNKMLSYRYDLDCWNAPRDVSDASFSCESPIYTGDPTYYNLVLQGGNNDATFDVTWYGTTYTTSYITMTNPGTGYLGSGNDYTIPGTSLGGVSPTNDLVIKVNTVDLNGAILTWEVEPLAPQTAAYSQTSSPFFSSRTVVYVRGILNGRLMQKDQGYAFLNNEPISSVFRRDNIKLLPNYSGKLMVHRILPEVVNLGSVVGTDNELPVNPATSTHKGNITVTLEGANSVASAPTAKASVTLAVDADGNNDHNPWAQIDQNAFRVNALELSNSSNNSIWMCSATTWQATQVEDDR